MAGQLIAKEHKLGAANSGTAGADLGGGCLILSIKSEIEGICISRSAQRTRRKTCR